MIRGTITTDAPTTARVLALAPDLGRALAATEADGGRFALDAPADADVVLLARLRGPVFAMAHARRGGDDGEVALDPAAAAPLHAVEVVADGDVPDELTLVLVPERVPGFADGAAERWTYRLSDDTSEEFGTWPLAAGRASLTVQAGTWRINATGGAGRARQAGALRTTWYVAAATDERGAELPVDAAGVRVTIAGPTTLRLSIARITHA